MKQKFGLDKMQKQIDSAVLTGMRQGSVFARNHFIQSFRDGGFTDKSLVKWQPRKTETKRTRGKGILISSGALRRSILVRQYNNKRFEIVSDMGLSSDKDYAPVHNFGLRAGRGRGFTMPKRQFMGESQVLNNKIINQIITNIQKLIK